LIRVREARLVRPHVDVDVALGLVGNECVLVRCQDEVPLTRALSLGHRFVASPSPRLSAIALDVESKPPGFQGAGVCFLRAMSLSPPEPDVSACLDETVEAVRARMTEPPSVGVVLGTGLGGFVARLRNPVSVPCSELPHMVAPLCLGVV